MTRAAPAPETVTLHVPFRLAKRGGRKEIQLPPGAPAQRRTDNTMVKALARAFRWKRMLETDDFATINELADREGIAPSYMTRVLRLTLLAPDIVEAILDGQTGPEVTLARLLEPFPVEWKRQTADSACFAPSSATRVRIASNSASGMRTKPSDRAAFPKPVQLPIRSGHALAYFETPPSWGD